MLFNLEVPQHINFVLCAQFCCILITNNGGMLEIIVWIQVEITVGTV